jgi:hypothetical protein
MFPLQRVRTQYIPYGGGLVSEDGSDSGSTLTYVPSGTTEWICVDSTHPGPPYRRGGSLAISKHEIAYGTTESLYSEYKFVPHWFHDGKFYCQRHTPTIAPVPVDPYIYGATAWKRALPLSPIMSLGVSIAELRDLPRMLTQTRDAIKALGNLPLYKGGKKTVGDFKGSGSGALNPGSNFLNFTFGWVPVINDLIGLMSLKDDLARKLSKIKSQNRTSVKRRLDLHNTDTETLVSDSGPTTTGLKPVMASQNYASTTAGRLVKTYRVQSHAWFEAKYSYYIPELDFAPTGLFGLSKIEQRLLGLELNAELIYNVIPWTWLLDWFTNVGDVVSNAVRFAEYHVVANYAYVMCTEVHTFRTYGCHLAYVDKGSFERKTRFMSASTTQSYTFKGRAYASPYGFALNESGFSLYQWAVLGALGLSRL